MPARKFAQIFLKCIRAGAPVLGLARTLGVFQESLACFDSSSFPLGVIAFPLESV